jgi:hypothetical protein
MGLHLPASCKIEAVLISYQLSSAKSFISRIQLTEMDTPDRATVIHDDTTVLQSTSAVIYTSGVGATPPVGDKSVELRLQLNFRNVDDEIRLGAVGIKYQLLAGRLNVLDYGARPDWDGATGTDNLSHRYRGCRRSRPAALRSGWKL